MPGIKKYICHEKCFFNGILYKPNDIKIIQFPANVKVPHHFVEVEDQWSFSLKQNSVALNKALEIYKEELAMLKKQKNPHSSIKSRIAKVEAQIKTITNLGYVPPDDPIPDKKPTPEPTPDPTPEPAPKSTSQSVQTEKKPPAPDKKPDKKPGTIPGENGK